VNRYRPLFIGHRGAKGLESENTLRSFRRAIKLGVDMVEFDVHLTRDAMPVVMHDYTVRRTTNGRGRIRNLTLPQFKQLRCKNNEAPPTLSETLRVLGRKTVANVEIKTLNAAVPVAQFFNSRNIRKILFSSFKWKALGIIRSILPDAKVGVLVERISLLRRPFKTAGKLNAWSINPSAALVSSRFMRKARKQGLKVLVYGLRNDKDLLRCFNLRVDGVFVDFPDRAMETFKAWKRQAL
jgi:glycerophosphoryl diester phosphodiesterase